MLPKIALKSLIGSLATFASFCPAVARAQGLPSDSLRSEPVRGLVRAIASGDTESEPRFWATVSSAGTPLVEQVAGEPHERLVTFIYRGDTATRAALVVMLGD